MKTKNKVRKAITKSLAVIISLVLLSITVNAQNFWKTVLENNSFSQIAMAMVDASETSPVTEDGTTTNDMNNNAEYFAVESEEAMDLENWMTNENNFFETVAIKTEVENSLVLEEWMTNENIFDGTAAYLKVETEETMEMEEWMTDTNYFGVQSVEVEEATENSLEIEAWMTNNNIWGN